jgi:hypothetical protein
MTFGPSRHVHPPSKRGYIYHLPNAFGTMPGHCQKQGHYTLDPHDHESNERNDAKPIDTRAR